MKEGSLLRRHPSLSEIRERFQARFAAFDDSHKKLIDPLPYPVELSDRLKALQEKVSRQAIKR